MADAARQRARLRLGSNRGSHPSLPLGQIQQRPAGAGLLSRDRSGWLTLRVSELAFGSVRTGVLIRVSLSARYNNAPQARGVVVSGGEGGIRTLGTGLPYTHFPGEPVRPLRHLSETAQIVSPPGRWGRPPAGDPADREREGWTAQPVAACPSGAAALRASSSSSASPRFEPSVQDYKSRTVPGEPVRPREHLSETAQIVSPPGRWGRPPAGDPADREREGWTAQPVAACPSGAAALRASSSSSASPRFEPSVQDYKSRTVPGEPVRPREHLSETAQIVSPPGRWGRPPAGEPVARARREPHPGSRRNASRAL